MKTSLRMASHGSATNPSLVRTSSLNPCTETLFPPSVCTRMALSLSSRLLAAAWPAIWHANCHHLSVRHSCCEGKAFSHVSRQVLVERDGECGGLAVTRSWSGGGAGLERGDATTFDPDVCALDHWLEYKGQLNVVLSLQR